MNKTLVSKREQTATEERKLSGNTYAVAPGVWRLKDIFVNCFVIQDADETGWVLVDAGITKSGAKIKKMVAEIFGSTGSAPRAILLTHGHFDHRGALIALADEWEVPVYCHHQELPYLTGRASYPPPDPSTGGGLMATLSFAYPVRPLDASEFISELPGDGSVPELNEWRWIHTPGHTPGHISLFRERDGVLIAGDAVVSTLQESLVSVATQAKIVSGPPKYLTPDWISAARSARELAALEPNVIATGHGQTFYGDEGRKALHKLVREFWQKAIPASGRYVKEAARFNEDGSPTHIPRPRGTMAIRLAGAVALFTVGYLVFRQRKSGSFASNKLSQMLGKTLMFGSLTLLGASAPASPALPDIPVIPEI